MDGIKERGNVWYNANKITKYPFSSRPSTKLTIEYMYHCLGGASTLKASRGAISVTGTAYYIYPHYSFFLSYHLSCNGYYVILFNGGKDPITGYGTFLVKMWGKS